MGFKRAFFCVGLNGGWSFYLRLFLVAIVSISVTGFCSSKFDRLKSCFVAIATTCVFEAAASFRLAFECCFILFSFSKRALEFANHH
jgi:hypothetical protein